MKQSTIEVLIQKKKEQIAILAEEISLLTDQKLFTDKMYYEDDGTITVKTGRKKADIKTFNVKLGKLKWTEDFVDEDSGEVISIERSTLAAINGKRTDMLGRQVKIIAELHEVNADKFPWEQYKKTK